MKEYYRDLQSVCTAIGPMNERAMEEARARQAMLAKPPGSLGRLEELSVQLAGITGHIFQNLKHKHLLVFAADNGVAEEGVSSAPQSVTLMQAINLTRGKTGAATMASHFGAQLTVVDAGINGQVPACGIVNEKIAWGTKNLYLEPAMRREQAVASLLVGVNTACRAAAAGADVLGVGEMGIGNTTTSSAMLAAFTGAAPEAVTGRGGGLTDAGYEKKLTVIRTALQKHKPDPADPIDVLAKVGGFELGAMAGAFLGAAACRTPVVIDGFCSMVSALCAYRLCPGVRDYLFPSHASFEIGSALAAKELRLRPLFDLSMRLGEGSGCLLAFEILSAAAAVLTHMATFAEAEIDDAYLADIRKGDAFTPGVRA